MTVIITIHFLHTHLSSAGAFVFMASIVLLTDCASCTFRPGWPAKQIALNSQNAQIAKKAQNGTKYRKYSNIFMDCSQFDDRCSFIPTHIVFNGNVFKCLEIFCSRQFDHHIGPRNMSDRSRCAEHPVTKTPWGCLAPEQPMAGSSQRLRIQSS